MRKILGKIFTNDKFFMVISVVGTVSFFINALFYLTQNIIDYDITMAISLLFLSVCQGTLYVSYIMHNKNVMKGMMGALLGALLLNASEWISSTVALDKVVGWIFLMLMIVLMFNHFVINSDHHSNPKNIYFNQILVIFCVILLLLWDILWAINNGGKIIGAAIVDAFCSTSVLACIVCVESRLDAYRIDRENAGWTKEEGYPKGYIHQKDR